MLSKTLSVLLAVLFVADFSHGETNQPHFRADYTYMESFGSYYKFHNTRKTWRDAKRTCSEEGASLFYPETADEANAVISFWKRAKNNAPRGTTWHADWMYVGISDIVTEGVYETIDGKSISEVYNNWNSNQPDDFRGAEDCVHMHVGGVLNDRPCSDEFSFICKKNFQSLVRTDSCDTQQDEQTNKPQFRADYTYMETFGSYYKFHNTRKTWRDAKRTCSEEGASLFYPETADEANAVISFWKRAKNNAPPGTTWHANWMYVGISDIVTEGLYETIDGKSISEVYHHWNSNQPDDFRGAEDCVHMHVGGVLNDRPCSDEFSFICKKNFQSLVRTDSCDTQQDGQMDQPQFRADYTYIETFGSYYKFHSTRKTWRDAKRTCSKEGASLFYPETADEAKAVISFWKRVKKNARIYTWHSDWMYVGISDIDTEGLFKTIDGKSISEVYHYWNSNQPDNFRGAEDCVHMHVFGVLNDRPCSDEFSFICKKSFQ